MEHTMTARERELIKANDTNRSDWQPATKHELVRLAEEFGIDYARAVASAKRDQIAADVAILDETKQALGNAISIEAAQWIISCRSLFTKRSEELQFAARWLETWYRDRETAA